MKKIGMMIVAGGILLSPCMAAFSDVDSSHWAYNAISRMENADILSGYNDGTFKPSRNITLAEFATIFTKIFELPMDNTSNYFLDIPSNHWAKGYTEAVREYINPFYDSVGEALGVTNYSYLKGIPADIEMTREAFIYAVSRIYGYDESLYIEGEEKSLFADYEEILYPKETVLAYKNNVISGEVVDGKVYIRPKRCITRAEASAIFKNLLKYEEKRVTNKGEEPTITAAFSYIIRDLKSEGILACKNFIYDTQGILNKDEFILTDNQISKLNELIEVVFSDFNYEVIDKGFYGFNRAYIKAKISSYDINELLPKLSISEEEFDNIIKDIKDRISKKKIKIIEKEEVFNFAKKDGEWKLVIK